MIKAIARYICSATVIVGVFAGPALAEGAHEAPIRDLVKTKIISWIQNPIVVASIKKQNEKHASLTQADIDKMDKQWRAEVKASGGAMIAKTLKNALSAYLKKIAAESKGLYTEIFVMDNKGLNVGQSDVTSDYWQGDEAKWKKTFLVGANQIHIGKVKTDESTQTLQSQASISIVDPADNKVIGAVTIGINVEMLGQ